MESLKRPPQGVAQTDLERAKVTERGPAWVGRATGHHGEIFQGVVRDMDGRLHRALSSLPCRSLRSEAIFYYPGTHGTITVNPGWKTKALAAAQLALAWADRPEMGGHLELHSDIPPGWGLGSSTSDVAATLRAVFSALKISVSEHVVARLAVKTEKACDSTIFDHSAVLFAHREGTVLQDLGGQIPECEVLGFNTDPSGAGVDTLEFRPARYTPGEIDIFADLVELLRQAVREQDVRLVAQVATKCARINQAYLPKPQFDRIEAVMDEVGAIGVQIAHSGTVVGLLFDPRDTMLNRRADMAKEEIAKLGFCKTWRFSTLQPEPLLFDWR